jgi:lysophospholipid acyltransferase (LPLAT)-like uncharacterized protein
MRAQVLSAIARLGGRVYRAYYHTLRLAVYLPDGSALHPNDFAYGRQIFVVCERDALAVAGAIAQRGFTVLVALGRDGEWVSAALGAMGCQIVRGSTLHDRVQALAALTEAIAASSRPAAIVADGPIGPHGRIRSGAFYCGMKTGRPVIGLVAAARRAFVFSRAWSHIYLPVPFTKVAVLLSNEIHVAGRDDIEPLRERMENWLREARGRALLAARVPGSRLQRRSTVDRHASVANREWP